LYPRLVNYELQGTTMQNDETLVVFRRWKDTGDLIALFPAIPSDLFGNYCLSYAALGQHAGADYFGVVQATRPASKEAAAPLAEELKRVGYIILRPLKRASHRVHEARRAEATRIRLHPLGGHDA
jgi:hypothetical protein